jgi:tape measure domain-containing protein
MAETHELRLKINAAAARAGSREFIGAINAIKVAVNNLDRDSSGAFTRINSNAKNLSIGIRGLSDAYNTARAANNKFATSIGKANAALARQVSLAKQARGALTLGSTPRAATPARTRGGEEQVTSQNRIKRAVDDTRLSVERLTTSLMKVSGFQSINELGMAFGRFKKEVSGAAVSTQQFDNAKTKLNSTIKGVQTSLVTLTAKAQKNARAEREAASAVRQRATANKASETSAKAAAAATKAQTAATQKQASIQLSSAQAIRQASQETERLINRLRAIGDVRGIAAINQALIQLRANTSGGVASTMQLRQAMSKFSDATNRAKTSLTQADGAHQQVTRSAKALAMGERDAAAQARLVEREMRSIAGASSAASQSMRKATGSMRGLENAFSSTFQIGTAFRTMLGSITFGAFTKSVFQAGAGLQQFSVAMEVATGSMRGAAQQMDFVDGLAQTLGISLRGARDDFGKFAVSASLAGVEASVAQDIFASVSEALTVMGRGAEDQKLSFLALEQMLSKNTISSEELRRQLGERLPGAVNLMAKAVGVTTQELQKMLKAGSLISSEVLPKFAVEVRKAFGPGLEQALTKAPAALGRFRSELELSLQAVSQSGFMEQVAEGLNKLTHSLRNPETKSAMADLGSGLADLATMAFDFAQTFIENIDTVAAVAKAVFGGIVVRQVLLMANALVTGGSRATLGFSTLTGAMTANTVAMEAHTLEMAVFVKGENAVTASTLSAKKATDLQVASQLRANGVFGVAPPLLAKTAVGLTGVGVAAGRMAAGMAIASRTIGLLAGPVGIIVTGLMLLPMLFSDTGDSADDAAKRITSAVQRAGISIDSFQLKLAKTTSSMNMNRLLVDLDTINSGLTNFVESNLPLLNELGSAFRRLEGTVKTTMLGMSFDEVDLGTLDIPTEAFENLSEASKNATKTVIEGAFAAATGERTWLDLLDATTAALATSPDASGVLEPLRKMVEENARLEIAIANNRDQLVELFGTDDDRAVKVFSNLALAAIKSGDSFDHVRSMIKDAIKEAPALAKRYQEVLDTISKGVARGDNPFKIHLEVQGSYDSVADEIAGLRTIAEDTAEAAAVAMNDFVFVAATTTEDIFVNGAKNVKRGVAVQFASGVQELVSQFAAFENVAFPLERLQAVLSEITFPTDSATEFSAAVERQFSALEPANRTYDRLRQILDSVAVSSRFAGVNMTETANSIAAAARASGNARINAADLRAEIIALAGGLGMTEAQAIKLTDGLLGSADAANTLAREATAAQASVDAIAIGFGNVTSWAQGAQAAIYGVVGAIRTLLGAAGSINAGFSGLIGRMGERIEIAKATGLDKAQKEFFASFGEGGKEIAAAQATVDNARQQVAEAQTWSERATATASLLAAQAALGLNKGVLAGQVAELFAVNEAAKENSGGGGGATQNKDAIEALTVALKDSIMTLDEENAALAMLSSGMTTSETGARLLAEAQMNGANLTQEQTKAFLQQIEAAELLNKKLKELANDPVNDFMKSVPSWREAGQQIEVGVFESLSDSISTFIKTGEFSFEALGESILGIVADIVADKAVKELTSLFGGNTSGSGEGGFGLGGMLSGLFQSRGDDADPFAGGLGGGGSGLEMQQAIATGGTQAAEVMRQAIIQAGQTVGTSISQGGSTAATQMGTSVTTGGTTAATAMGTSVTTSGTVAGATIGGGVLTGCAAGAPALGAGVVGGATAGAPILAAGVASGAGGGGFLSKIFGGGGGGGGFIASFFAAVAGVTGGGGPAISSVMAPAAAFRQAPSFAMGTGNVSGGIPAILHDNEAVVPLTGGRRVPVDMGADGGKGGSKTVIQNFNISTPDADSFRKSQKQIAAEAISSGQRALNENG